MDDSPYWLVLYRVADLDGDGTPEVVLLVVWPPVVRNGVAPGAVMRRARLAEEGRGGWVLGCGFAAPPSRALAVGPGAAFRIGGVSYAWTRPSPGAESVCAPTAGRGG